MCGNRLCRHAGKHGCIALLMVTMYADYGDEPEDSFIPLPAHLACTYYDLEMNGYKEDALFYDSVLPEKARVLELGCGSGRVGRKLLNGQRSITGVDISLPMLKRAKEGAFSSMQFLAMDMTALAFSHSFDAVVIAYNSLNLLITKERILRCLQGCRQYLQQGGTLTAQIFIPTQKFIAEQKKSFQFQIFDTQPRGRVIKEILKKYHRQSQAITVEERFRVRPVGPGAVSADYNSMYTVAAFETAEWLQLFEKSGFRIKKCYEDFLETPAGKTDSSCLIVVCE